MGGSCPRRIFKINAYQQYEGESAYAIRDTHDTGVSEINDGDRRSSAVQSQKLTFPHISRAPKYPEPQSRSNFADNIEPDSPFGARAPCSMFHDLYLPRCRANNSGCRTQTLGIRTADAVDNRDGRAMQYIDIKYS